MKGKRIASLYSHQKVMLRFSLSRFRSAYLAEVGTGKTRPAIMTFYIRKTKGRASKCLVVCPSSIMYNWQDEINMLPYGLKSIVIYSKSSQAKKKRLAMLDENADIYIINYDYLSKMKIELIDKGFDFIIVDELTYAKHHNTLRSKALRLISRNIRYRLGLTGSPITNTPLDAFGEMLVIDPAMFGTNYFAFRNHYFVNKGRYFPAWLPTKSRMTKMANKLAETCIFLEKKDCLDLPPVTFETRQLEMSSKMLKDYKEMKNHLILELENEQTATGPIILTKLLRLAQITSGFVKSEDGELVELGYNPKLDELAELLDGELAGKKVIVWARFVRTIEQLQERFAELKPAVVWGGDTDMKHRQAEIKRFGSDPECLLFIGQIAIGFGFNLTASDTMVYVEQDFSVEHRTQTMGRNDRIGQKAEKLTVIDIVMNDTIDTYTLKSLRGKQNVAEFIYEILDMRRKEK